MRDRVIALFALIALGVCGFVSAAQEAIPKNEITGVWRLYDGGLLALTLVVTDEGGSLTGAIQFYLLRQDSADAPRTSTPVLPEPLLRVQFDGRTLRFEVSHRRAHPPETLNDEPARFRVTLTGPNSAEIMNESEPDLAAPMVRSDH